MSGFGNPFAFELGGGPSDQGYHSYLYYSGEFGKVRVYPQGEGPVNTIGAIGDCWISWKVVGHPADTWFQDTKSGTQAWRVPAGP